MPWLGFKPTTLVYWDEGLLEISKLLVSLDHTGKRVVLGHTLNTLWHIITKKSHNVLSKFTILCWAAFIAILGCMRPTGGGLVTPVTELPGRGLSWNSLIHFPSSMPLLIQIPQPGMPLLQVLDYGHSHLSRLRGSLSMLCPCSLTDSGEGLSHTSLLICVCQCVGLPVLFLTLQSLMPYPTVHLVNMHWTVLNRSHLTNISRFSKASYLWVSVSYWWVSVAHVLASLQVTNIIKT